MSDTEYFETPLNELFSSDQTQSSTDRPQQPSPQQPSLQQPSLQQPSLQQPSLPISGKLLDVFTNLNFRETFQTIIILCILFIIFSSCQFKQLCGTLPFLCVTDGEFNIQSLIIIGVFFGFSYVLINNYII